LDAWWFAINAVIEYNESAHAQEETSMATLTIRNLDAALKERLRVRAAQHGHSMEAEVRSILQHTLNEPERPAVNLYQRIRNRFAPLGGVDLELPPRELVGEPPRFD
jgi:antitoxin FitA